MLLQSYEGVIRIFPNRSSLQKGRIEFVNIQSEKGRTCVMENPWPGKTVQLIRNEKKIAILSGNRFSFDTKENELLILKEI